MAGRVLGTTDYVSPEQALGQPVTGQSDLYSLGIVLYEMLTGEVPFRGETPVAVAMKHVREEVARRAAAPARSLRGDGRGARPRARQGPRAPLPRRGHDGARARGRARDRGLALGAGHRRGDERAAHAARRRAPAAAVAHCATPSAGGDSLALLCAAVAAAARARARPDAPRHGHRAGGGSPQRASAGAAQPDGRPRLQPVRHRAGKPRPRPQRRRQRPEHHLEHRAVLRRHAAQASGGTRPRHLPRRRARRGRARAMRDPDADAGLRACTSTPPTTSTWRPPYGDSTPLAARGWQGPLGEARAVRDGERVAAAQRRATATATT